MTRLAVVGAGWAGLAAAVQAASMGAEVTVFEAARSLGGRARSLDVPLPDGRRCRLDNGQHILIGAYSETLQLMQRVGVDLASALLPLPLSLRHADGTGVMTPSWASRWPAPWDGLMALLSAKGWSWRDRWGTVRAALQWRTMGFDCDASLTVQDLCSGVPARGMAELIEPLCVSALNLPSAQANAQVFLRVMRDALFGKGVAGYSPSALLLPRQDLGQLFPEAALDWLQREVYASVHLGRRVSGLRWMNEAWGLMTDEGETAFDQVIWATPAHNAAPIMQAGAHGTHRQALLDWAGVAERLPHTAITTVYAHAPDARLELPMLALRGAPAQFVFDRGQLQGDRHHRGVLAFVVSASHGEREALQSAVLDQARQELGLDLQPLQTVVEKRATFACLSGIERPAMAIAPRLWAAGDHVAGPYPATLEAAVRSGIEAGKRAMTPSV